MTKKQSQRAIDILRALKDGGLYKQPSHPMKDPKIHAPSWVVYLGADLANNILTLVSEIDSAEAKKKDAAAKRLKIPF